MSLSTQARSPRAAGAPAGADTSSTTRTPTRRTSRLRVLHSLNPPDGTTKYVDQMVDGAPAEVEVLFFSWWRALLGRYDVLHVHWPELLVRDRRRIARLAKRRALDALLIRLRLLRVPIVWTAHNLEPHEPGPPAEQRSLERFHRAVTLVIRLNPTTQVDGPQPVVTILHGHYRAQFAEYEHPPTEPGRLLYFGIIRPYKGVDRLLDAFRALADPDVSLRVVGHPHAGQREIVEAATDVDPRITADLRFVEDAQLAEEFGRSEVVVLPYRENMHNSGVVLVALSLDRPVLVPRSPTNEALAAEVGPGWIVQYDGELGPQTLTAALAEVRARPGLAGPRLEDRDWDVVGARHHDAYRRARALARRGRRRRPLQEQP